MKDFFKNKCDIICDLLPLYADDSCSKATKERVALHLVTCKKCRDYYKEIKSYHETVSIDTVPPTDRQFIEVMSRLHRKKTVRNSLVATAIVASLAINAILLLNND